MKTFFISLLFLLVIVSCGPKVGTTNSSATANISTSEIQAIMDNQVFECVTTDGKTCPEGITRLLIINKKKPSKSKLCSGFMMGPYTMVTNQHCISNIGDCKNTFVAIYNGSSHVQNRCSSIVRLLNDIKDPSDPRKALDVAIVKLEKKYEGKAFRPSETRASPGQTVSAFVIDHTGNDKINANLYESRILEVKCRVSSSQDHQSLVLKNCPIIQGNSGSPLFDGTGKVLGVIWGGTSRFNSLVDLETRKRAGGVATVTEISHFVDYLSK